MKTTILAFCRMNPMTTGHMLLVKTMNDLASENGCEAMLYLSHSQDKKNKKDALKNKNPLDYPTKVSYAKTFINNSPYSKVNVVRSEARTVMEALHEIYLNGFEKVIVIAGSDRVNEFRALVEKYNGAKMKDSDEYIYLFEDMDFVQAGEERDENDTSVKGMSASKMRKLACEGDFESFRQGVPSDDEEICHQMYEDIREKMI